jgi:cytochrome c553
MPRSASSPSGADSSIHPARPGAARRGAAAALLVALVCAGGRSADAAPAVEDTIAQRALACTGCHGREGRAASDGYYPRIAGKPAGYLYNQLLNFRDGRRSYALMTHLVQHLSDAYLQELAGYFANLDLPYPAPQPAAVDRNQLERGKSLVNEGDPGRRIPACTECHGATLTGVAPAVPGLLGLPRDYLNAQFGAWRIGQRKALEPDCMAQVARQLHPDDIAALTAWLAAQPVPESSKPAETLPAPMPLRCGGVPASAAGR